MVVYLVGNLELKWFKIGVSKFPAAKRTREIQNSVPFPVVLLGHVTTRLGEALEEDVHTRFWKNRIRGEWFRDLDIVEVMTYMNERLKQYA